MLLPHEVLHAIFISGKHQFDNILLGNLTNATIRKFWMHVKQQEPWEHHEILHSFTEEELGKVIPFAAHGDGAELYTDQEYFVWSWCSAFSFGSMFTDTLVNRFPVCVVSEMQMLHHNDPRTSENRFCRFLGHVLP